MIGLVNGVGKAKPEFTAKNTHSDESGWTEQTKRDPSNFLQSGLSVKKLPESFLVNESSIEKREKIIYRLVG